MYQQVQTWKLSLFSFLTSVFFVIFQIHWHFYYDYYTAYVNGQRQGRILEKPFGMGDTIKRETSPEFSAKATPILDIESEIRLAFSWAKTSWDAPLVQKMKDLGLERYHKLQSFPLQAFVFT